MPRATKNPVVYLALSPAATATALGFTPQEVRKAIAAGELPALTRGVRVRVMCSDAEHWMRTTWHQPKQHRAVSNG